MQCAYTVLQFLYVGKLLEEEQHNYIWLQDKCIASPTMDQLYAAHLPII